MKEKKERERESEEKKKKKERRKETKQKIVVPTFSDFSGSFYNNLSRKMVPVHQIFIF